MVVLKGSLEDAINFVGDRKVLIFTPKPTQDGHRKLVGSWQDFIEQNKGILRKETVVIFYNVASIHQRIISFLTLSRLCEVVLVPKST